MPEPLALTNSRLGISFTKRSIGVMQIFQLDMKKVGCRAICYSIARRADGSIDIGLGGDYDAQPGAIADEVDGVVFYWYADLPMMQVLDGHAVDSAGDALTRLMPLES